MQIEFNTSSIAKRDTTPAVASPAAPAVATDSASFASATALDSQLNDVSTTRADKVESAKLLVGDKGYPPEELLNRIATLLAITISR